LKNGWILLPDQKWGLPDKKAAKLEQQENQSGISVSRGISFN
jgi:hypothetical protein